MPDRPVAVYARQRLAEYHFGDSHPFGPQRYAAFMGGLQSSGVATQVAMEGTAEARPEDILLFHEPIHLEHVRECSLTGEGHLDMGDTPAREGIYEAAACVVGTVLRATADLVAGRYRRAFVPIAGLHHAAREMAAGFCVFNDIGIAIEALRHRHGVRRVAYVDIDAHHGDGVFYGFEYDAELIFVDLHEDGRYLYPGTGRLDEIGLGEAEGTKLNLPLDMNAGDEEFLEAWTEGAAFLREFQPEFIILQAGADCLAGDPITHLKCSSAVHRQVTRDLCAIADDYGQGRLLGLGGGGYNLANIAEAWVAVVEEMVACTPAAAAGGAG